VWSGSLDYPAGLDVMRRLPQLPGRQADRVNPSAGSTVCRRTACHGRGLATELSRADLWEKPQPKHAHTTDICTVDPQRRALAPVWCPAPTATSRRCPESHLLNSSLKEWVGHEEGTWASGQANGSETVKREPSPGRDSSVTVMLSRSAIRRTIQRPSPRPSRA
jgi:hypothetical protein